MGDQGIDFFILSRARTFLIGAGVLLLLLFSCSRNEEGIDAAGPVLPKNQTTNITLGSRVDGELNDEITTSIIMGSFRTQAALSQFFRWFQFYEHEKASLNHQTTIVAPEIQFDSNQGFATGVEAYQTTIHKIPRVWQNSHFVSDVHIERDKNNMLMLDADIIFLNRGALVQNHILGSRLKIKSQFNDDFTSVAEASEQTDKESALPLMRRMNVSSSQNGKVKEYQSSYAQNRLKSLLHYWLHLIENPNRSLDDFEVILTETYRTEFSEEDFASEVGMQGWLVRPEASAKAMHYRVRNIQIEELDMNKYSLKAEMDWYGLIENDEQVTGRVNQIFAVIDDPHDPYAKISAFEEEEVVPGAPRPDDLDVSSRVEH